MINKKKAKEYLFIAGVTLGLPLAAEMSGVSKAFSQKFIQEQRHDLVYMLNNPEYLSTDRDSVQKNLDYINTYSDLRNKSAKCGANALALLLGFAGASCSILAKRKLEEDK